MAVQMDTFNQKDEKIRQLEKMLEQYKGKLDVYEREENMRCCLPPQVPQIPNSQGALTARAFTSFQPIKTTVILTLIIQ